MKCDAYEYMFVVKYVSINMDAGIDTGLRQYVYIISLDIMEPYACF